MVTKTPGIASIYLPTYKTKTVAGSTVPTPIPACSPPTYPLRCSGRWPSATRARSERGPAGPRTSELAPLTGDLPARSHQAEGTKKREIASGDKAGGKSSTGQRLPGADAQDGFRCETNPILRTDGTYLTHPGVRILQIDEAPRDRKSTRLNSSHRTISYAVFCLKKK